MTLAEIETAARNRYNAQGDTNWSSSEIAQIIYEASLEVTRDCGLVIEKRFQSTSVAGTGEYAIPSQANSIKRVTYDGMKLREIDMRQDDVLTIENQLTTDIGVPEGYFIWERTFHLRPIPSDAKTIEVYAICSEQALSTNSVLETPERFHGSLVTYVIKEMAAKDLNWEMYDRYDRKWQTEKMLITRQIRKSKRSDGFAIVKTEEALPNGTFGVK